VGDFASGLSINITWRESADQNGWVQHLPCVSCRKVGAGTGVDVGCAVGAGVGLGGGVGLGASAGVDDAAAVAAGWLDEVRLSVGEGALLGSAGDVGAAPALQAAASSMTAIQHDPARPV
jgi:hypothetical protein